MDSLINFEDSIVCSYVVLLPYMPHFTTLSAGMRLATCTCGVYVRVNTLKQLPAISLVYSAHHIFHVDAQIRGP